MELLIEHFRTSRTKQFLLTLSFLFGLSGMMRAQSSGRTNEMIPHLQKHGTATQFVVNGKPYLMLAGELHNSSASSVRYMKPIWAHLDSLHLNTVIATISWELTEPKKGTFNYTLIDSLINEARAHNLHLVFIWFGTWKNAGSTYAPAWVKTDLEKYPRMQNRPGHNLEALSPFGEATMKADANAFAHVMRHIRQVDSHHTVLAIQVENETGILGSARDRSPIANAAFTKNVPDKLMNYLEKHRQTLLPELREIWTATGYRKSGTWQQVFGEGADEVFMAWYIGSYVNDVASAGKKEYPLPMYVNAWLVQPVTPRPGQYPSGGPVSKMMDVWRAAAPSIDYFAPDIYAPAFKKIVKRYHRSGNPLFIPEVRADLATTARSVYVFGELDAMCFSPFGIENLPANHPLSDSYNLLHNMMPLITKYQGTGKMRGVLQSGDQKETITLGDYNLHIAFTASPKDKIPGFGLIVNPSPDEYLITGSGMNVTFTPVHPGNKPIVDFLSVDEGWYKNGTWIPGRRLNGDEAAGYPQVPFYMSNPDSLYQSETGLTSMIPTMSVRIPRLTADGHLVDPKSFPGDIKRGIAVQKVILYRHK